MKLSEYLGRVLRAQRESLGLSQFQFCVLNKTNYRYYQRLESLTANMTLATLERMAKHLNTTAQRLAMLPLVSPTLNAKALGGRFDHEHHITTDREGRILRADESLGKVIPLAQDKPSQMLWDIFGDRRIAEYLRSQIQFIQEGGLASGALFLPFAPPSRCQSVVRLAWHVPEKGESLVREINFAVSLF